MVGTTTSHRIGSAARRPQSLGSLDTFGLALCNAIFPCCDSGSDFEKRWLSPDADCWYVLMFRSRVNVADTM